MSPQARRSNWETPDWLFDQLHREFLFTVDASADAENFKIERYWDIENDGLSRDWSRERVWCNPPYGREIWRWIRKARESSGLVVMLLPVRSETAWWCEDVLASSEIRFIQGRVHFKINGGVNPHPKGSRPVFASVIVIFGSGAGPRISTMKTPYIEKHTQQPPLLSEARRFV